MTITSSTGGQIVRTENGLKHFTNSHQSISESSDVNTEQKLTYDFSQFPTVTPPNNIPGVVVKFR